MKNTTKIFYMGRRLNGRYDSFKSAVNRIVNWAIRAIVVSGAAAGVFFAGAFFYSTSTVMATTLTVQTPAQFPVLDRIADCESGDGTKGSATQIRNGQVLMKGNTNKTVDVGKYQINLTYWGKKATELGYDITTLDGNTKMAEWIYLNRGTGDWSASHKCWAI